MYYVYTEKKNLIHHQNYLNGFLDISYIFDVITSRSVYSYINGLFTWSLTKEGHAYWSEINIKWEQLLSKLYIKT